jgi:hypothetical protein
VSGITDVLFEVEPPNLFRDSLVEQTLAVSTMKQVLKRPQCAKYAAEFLADVRKAMTKAEEVVKSPVGESPIDEKFDLRRRVRLRMEIWRFLL